MCSMPRSTGAPAGPMLCRAKPHEQRDEQRLEYRAGGEARRRIVVGMIPSRKSTVDCAGALGLRRARVPYGLGQVQP